MVLSTYRLDTWVLSACILWTLGLSTKIEMIRIMVPVVIVTTINEFSQLLLPK